MLHIYTSSLQPATGWIDTHSGRRHKFGFDPEQLIYTDCCGKKRYAKNCVVQSYYDGLKIWCADGCGCKNPQVIAKKRRREHMVRSRAQQARRARESARLA